MSSVFHGAITVSIFGQSHAPGIGVVVDGLPAGEKIDLDELQAFLTRRAPGTGSWSTPRKEADAPEILSGLADGVTCGAPLAAVRPFLRIILGTQETGGGGGRTTLVRSQYPLV